MTGSNHLVTGALIAAIIPQPTIAIPLAFISHFVLDALPHYGHKSDERYWLTKGYTRVIVADLIIGSSLLLSIAVIQPLYWQLMLVCAIVSVLPDILWVPYYLYDLKHSKSKERHGLIMLLKRIQVGERPWGIYVEAAWLVVFTGLFITITV